MKNPYNYFMIILPHGDGSIRVYEDFVDGLNGLGTIHQLPNGLGFLARESNDVVNSGLGVVRETVEQAYTYLVDKWENGSRQYLVEKGALRPKV